jgi:hypothetical protein
MVAIVVAIVPSFVCSRRRFIRAAIIGVWAVANNRENPETVAGNTLPTN